MARRKGWTTVRVRVQTRDRLRAYCRRVTAAVQSGQSTRELSDQPCTGGAQGGLTLDSAVTALLDADDAHRELSRRWEERRPPRKRQDKTDRLPAADAGDPLVTPAGEPLPAAGPVPVLVPQLWLDQARLKMEEVRRAT